MFLKLKKISLLFIIIALNLNASEKGKDALNKSQTTANVEQEQLTDMEQIAKNLLHTLAFEGTKDQLEGFLRSLSSQTLVKIINHKDEKEGNAALLALHADNPDNLKILISYGAQSFRSDCSFPHLCIALQKEKCLSYFIDTYKKEYLPFEFAQIIAELFEYYCAHYTNSSETIFTLLENEKKLVDEFFESNLCTKSIVQCSNENLHPENSDNAQKEFLEIIYSSKQNLNNLLRPNIIAHSLTLKNQKGQTPFFFICAQGDPYNIQQYLTRKQNVTHVDIDGNTALAYAIDRNKLYNIKMLLNYYPSLLYFPCSFNTKEFPNNKKTLLVYAICLNKILITHEIISQLLKNPTLKSLEQIKKGIEFANNVKDTDSSIIKMLLIAKNQMETFLLGSRCKQLAITYQEEQVPQKQEITVEATKKKSKRKQHTIKSKTTNMDLVTAIDQWHIKAQEHDEYLAQRKKEHAQQEKEKRFARHEHNKQQRLIPSQAKITTDQAVLNLTSQQVDKSPSNQQISTALLPQTVFKTKKQREEEKKQRALAAAAKVKAKREAERAKQQLIDEEFKKYKPVLESKKMKNEDYNVRDNKDCIDKARHEHQDNEKEKIQETERRFAALYARMEANFTSAKRDYITGQIPNPALANVFKRETNDSEEDFRLPSTLTLATIGEASDDVFQPVIRPKSLTLSSQESSLENLHASPHIKDLWKSQ